MFSPRVTPLLAALVLAPFAGSAQSAAQRPTEAEDRWVLACVEGGGTRCQYCITARCYGDGYRDAVPAPVPRVRGRIADHPRNCAPIETAI
ncbi:MAG: hypothetical protein JWO24_920 [Rhodospirillales bacterium]|jgi:hypothetical protein|nr:hypothetical protein [Rhodospirillales bacterium]